MTKAEDKKTMPPAPSKKPGQIDIDVDDAMIEEPKDDAFGKEAKPKGKAPEKRPPGTRPR